MAVFSTNSFNTPSIGFAGIARAIGNAFLGMAERNRRVTEMNRLNALSDAELAKIGLERADIARHVFRDVYFM